MLNRYCLDCFAQLTSKFGSDVKGTALQYNIRNNGSRRNLDDSNTMVQNPLGLSTWTILASQVPNDYSNYRV